MSESKNPNQPPFQEPRPQEPVSELEKGEGMSSSVPPMDAKEPLRLIGSFRIDPPDPELMSSEIAMRDHPLSAWDTSRSVTLPPTSEKRLEETIRPDVSEGEKGPDLAESAEIVLPSDPMIVGQDSPEIESAREMCRKHDARLAERKRKQQRAGEDGTQISGARQEESAAEDALWAERKRQEEEQKHFGEIAEWERLQEKRSLEELQRRELDARLAELARREQEIRKAESAQKHENERLTALAQELGREEARLEALAAQLGSHSNEMIEPEGASFGTDGELSERTHRDAEAHETETSDAEKPDRILELPASISSSDSASEPDIVEEEDEGARDPWLVRYLVRVGETVADWLCAIGDFAYFASQVFHWLLRLPRRGTLLPCAYEIGIRSLPVIALTGMFIGMVLSVQSYAQLKDYYLETRMGALINLSLVRELGPVLAATMLAGRIGSSMAAELGTMRVTEQIDALGSMGVNPIHYLVVPRFLGCVFLIPILTIFADFMGVVGGAYFSVWIFNIDWHFYLMNSNKIVGEVDIFIGVFKSFFFGATIGLIGCHRGFSCRAGAQGVGRAATESFVLSFVFILLLDLALGTIFEALDEVLFTPMPRQI